MKELQTITLILISVEQRMHTSHCTATDGHPWRLKQHPINLRDSHLRQLWYATDKQHGDNLSLATPRDSFSIFSVVSPELYFLFFIFRQIQHQTELHVTFGEREQPVLFTAGFVNNTSRILDK